MIDILTAPTAAAASTELFSTPHLAPLAQTALAALNDWAAACEALDAEAGTAHEVETARLAMVSAYRLYTRLVDDLVTVTSGTIAVDPGLRYMRETDAAWEDALDNPDAYAAI